MLTKKQRGVFDYIKQFHVKHKYAPSLEEIKKHFKLASVSTAHFYVKKLQEKGCLKKENNQPRAICIFESEKMINIPLMGNIAAGQPIEAIKERETIAVPLTGLTHPLN